MSRSSKPTWKTNKELYDSEYRKTHYRNVGLNFNIETESDMFEHLEKMGNKTEYIKKLIKADMAKYAKEGNK